MASGDVGGEVGKTSHARDILSNLSELSMFADRFDPLFEVCAGPEAQHNATLFVCWNELDASRLALHEDRIR